MKTILLKFSGPLQSWGTDSHFETRHTDFYPSKSAVIGIIAASLGYRRNEDEKIQKLNELDFGVRVDQPGTLLRDYHIARKYKPDGNVERTYVTERYYLEDAVFVVAVSHEDDDYMDRIEHGLKRPYFQTFMGRRSLPMCAECIVDVLEQGVVNALQNYEWQAADWYQKKCAHENIKLQMYADADLLENKAFNLRRDRVISFSQKERKFGFRYESNVHLDPVISVNDVDKNCEHDIWDSVGE